MDSRRYRRRLSRTRNICNIAGCKDENCKVLF
jgi:hypothetical protein